MTSSALPITLAVTAMILAGCDDHDGRMVNSKICADFAVSKAAPAGAVPVVTDAASPVDECVRRWAYSLAGARDGADVVANAAVAACGAPLTRWNQASLDQPPAQDSSGAPIETLNVDTGQPTTAMAEHTAFAHRQALLYVVQARAGRCKPPPATKGAPTGA